MIKAFSITLLVCFFMFMTAGAIVFSTYQEEQDTYKFFLYKKIVLKNDTLRLTDYSVLRKEFTLSNQQKVSLEKVIKSKVIK